MRCLLMLLTCLVLGCGPVVVPIDQSGGRDTKPDQVTVEKATPEAVWMALSQAVAAGNIDTARELGQFVSELRKNGELTDQDVSRFNSEFVNAPSDESPLSAIKDSKRVRGLAQ